MKDELFTTLTNQVIQLSNIAYVSDLDCGQLWDDNYHIKLKHGGTVTVSAGRDYRGLKADRDNLLAKWKLYMLSQDKVSS